MTLLEEYKKQNLWREWERYIDMLPLSLGQVVYDLGCSVGAVSRLLAEKAEKVIAIDNDETLLREARKNAPSNCEFISDNIFTLSPEKYGKCDGIWMSFTLAYINKPGQFISNWARCLKPGGWFALTDIDALFSCHLSEGDENFGKIDAFEKLSEQSGIYDFRIGRKIRGLMEQSGLEIVFGDDDWYDKELNFRGCAEEEIAANWSARLDRMQGLKSFMGPQYREFCKSFLTKISSESHNTHGGVRFYVGVKK